MYRFSTLMAIPKKVKDKFRRFSSFLQITSDYASPGFVTWRIGGLATFCQFGDFGNFLALFCSF